MASEQIGDVSLTNAGKTTGGGDRLVVWLPMKLARALIKGKYTRVTVHVSEEGILLKPYRGERASNATVRLPFETDGASE